MCYLVLIGLLSNDQTVSPGVVDDLVRFGVVEVVDRPLTENVILQAPTTRE
jgi:hypothetical protein